MLAVVTLGTLVWFLIVTVISSVIVGKMKISNWWMIVIIPAVWVALSIILGLLNLLIVLLPLLIIGAILFWLLKKQTTIKP